jgi:carbonic anhydrase
MRNLERENSFIVRNEPAGAPLDDYIERLTLASIVQGLANLRTFPWIAEREQ